MLALSVRQPWAWLIVNGHKDIENRKWTHSHRGHFLVHAGKTSDWADWLRIEDWYPEIFKVMPSEKEIQKGGIVGVAKLVDVVRTHASEWFNGPYGFVLEDAKPVKFRQCRGQLNFFTPGISAASLDLIVNEYKAALRETAGDKPESSVFS